MKKLVLLVLINVSCYGNTVVKESFIRKIFVCLCPCFKKTPKPEIRSSMRRVANSDNLKEMIPMPVPEEFRMKVDRSNPISEGMKNYMEIERMMIRGIQERIAEKEKQIEENIERIKNRDLSGSLPNE